MVDAILYFYVFWFGYLACSALRWKWADLPLWEKVIAAPGVLAFLVLDVVSNLTLFTVIFMDKPTTWTLTQRLTKYKGGNDWRDKVACIICSNLLDPFEIGGHCK